MSYKLLLVENDPRLARTVMDLLGHRGYSIEAATGEQALKVATSGTFDLIILDGLNGLEACAELRRRKVAIPILLLTADSHPGIKVAGFQNGADDCLAKPFEGDELRVRIEALLRRTARSRETALHQFGGVKVNFDKSEVVRHGRTIALSERESRLLRYFIENRSEVISRDTLLEQVWGYDRPPFTRTVDVHILRLRQKIEDDPRNPHLIVTVHGLGYRFNG